MSRPPFRQLDDRYQGEYADDVRLTSGPPPSQHPYASMGRPRSKLNPVTWGTKTCIAVAVGFVVLLIIVIVGAVVGVRNNRYPDYSPLRYSLQDTYGGPEFFDDFDYFTGYDPTGGFVHYVDQPGSVALNLTSATASSAILKVDTTELAASTGRKSARVSSKKQYNSGLFIFDILHTPYGCGTWPALWLVDQVNWPMNGEIDVVEAVNAATTGNQMALHTSKGCTMNVKRKATGEVLSNNCHNATNNNQGCAVRGEVDTFGAGFNQNGGGIYAMEWRSAGIRIWFFPRSSIPPSLDPSSPAPNPDPSTFGTPLADYPSTDCDINKHFRNQSIVANVDLCGTWAGQPEVYNTQGGCPGLCSDRVANSPEAFEQAYWEFGNWWVYQAA
ncbi:MAG: hypothetical protein M1817_000582 [Caeruleum heppii]|nr:MAG: hypothetical protein M1817_000582 [Caeruleum heppii]